MLIYNSLKDKTPFGAVKTGEYQYFTVRMTGDRPTSVNLVLYLADAGYRSYPFKFDRECDGYIYTLRLPIFGAGLYYYSFEVFYGENNEYKVSFGRDLDCNSCENSNLKWQLTVSDSAYSAPLRWGGDIIYQVLIDRFNRVGEIQPIDYGTIHTDWDDDINVSGKDGIYRADDYFGGNLRGLIDKLEYIKDLGVTILYLNPIFLSHSNHRYNTSDYSIIDPMVGTEEEFAELVGKARICGMRVMLDGVFNHTGADSVYFNKDGYFDSFGAYQGSASPYRDWYYFKKDGSYHSWWGIDCVPTLNKKNKKLINYLFGKNGIVAKWDTYDIDWRLDVVDELPGDFLEELVSRIKHDNPKATVLGEVWEDATTKYAYGSLRPYFTQGQLDGVMNYPFRSAIINYALGGSATDFRRAVMSIIENYPKENLDNCMTLLGSHDTVRILNALAGVRFDGWSKARQKEYVLSSEQKRIATDRLFVASILQYTLPGIPSIYYGDEVGVEGGEDPVNRRTYPWGRENRGILNHFKQLGVFRGNYAEALDGTTEVTEYDGMVVIKRKGERSSITVIANTTGYPKNYPLDGEYIDVLTDEEHSGNLFLYNDYAVILTKK